MTDLRQFGDREDRNGECARCEAMLADAVDGMLSEEEQAFFDAHMGVCDDCTRQLGEARRGAAWLEMLKMPAPEPPPALLEKILAQTAGAMQSVPMAQPVPAHAGHVLHFPRPAARRGGWSQVMLQPRLAMTAAMAFVSIVLTLDLTGVNPMDLRANDLSPSSLRRAAAGVNARVVQYYEGLRVVYEMESRVRELQNVQEDARPASPAPKPAPVVTDDPTDDAPELLQDQNLTPGAAAPQRQNDDSAPSSQEQNQQPKGDEHRKADAGPGMSRSEDFGIGQRQVAMRRYEARRPERRAA